MDLIYLITFFILGTLMGSFLTVIGYRLPNHEDFIKTRSHCDNCKHKLSLIDMVPIISYLFLRGKCRYCKKKIEPISSYMEFFTGVLFSLSFFIFGFSYELLIALGIVCLLIIISVSDITYYIIPDEVLIFFTGYFLIINTLQNSVMDSLFKILSGMCMFGIMYSIMVLGSIMFRKESLGGGDIKLMFVIGIVLSPFLGLLVIFFASILALPLSIIIILRKKKNLIPFGPFLVISFMFIYFTKIDVNVIVNFLKSI